MNNKQQLGQFFTVTNPFEFQSFKDWFFAISNWEKEIIIEPFAGANNIVKMILDISNNKASKWVCFDINPDENNVLPQYKIIEQDTIKNFPKGYKIAITNPPYLAKNSATRRGLNYLGEPYDDLYKKSLEVMLNNCKYVAAIIPESFITAGLFQQRLSAVISLTCKMFDDTDCPVCLALFNPEESTDFKIYRNNYFIGNYSQLKKYLYLNIETSGWKVNDKTGTVGCICIDNTKQASIKFVKGQEISPDEIKVSSRALTRISGLPNNIDIDEFIQQCNKELNKYRNKTQDVFMTSFKGLRNDGKYRRRLDFKTMKQIMSVVLTKMTKNLNKNIEKI